MRRIALKNYLTFPLHLTFIRFSSTSLRFVFSKRQIPVPSGQILTRKLINPQQGIVSSEIDDDISITFSQKGLGSSIALTQRLLRDNKGTEIVECTIHFVPPETTDDE